MSPLTRSANNLEQALDASGSRESALARANGAYDAVTQGASKIIIFGCGHLGKVALSGAINAGLEVVAIADNKESNWGRTIKGVPVISPGEAVAKYNHDGVFVVGIYNGTPPRTQLQNLGCKRIVPFPMFFWRFSEFFPAENGLDLPHRIFDNLDSIRSVYVLLDDEASRREFAAQIQWRSTLDYNCLPPPTPSADTYYPPELIQLNGQEVLVDCGAFDGDSIKMFLATAGNSFRYIYAIEPDPMNRASLKSTLASLPPEQFEKIKVLPFGLGNENETVFFNVTGTAGSSITTGEGSISIECRRLDDILDGPDPTFVKMDIEGAEPYAIEGATETIRRARPILAICSYHKSEHLWKLPVLIKKALPEYHLFLRRHAEECWEIVYYAIPPERLLPNLK